MAAIIIFILLLLVLYVYTSDTFAVLFVAMRATGRLILVLLTAFLILGLIAYSLIKYGSVFRF